MCRCCLVALLLSTFLLGFVLGLRQPNGRSLWGDCVLGRHQNPSSHADPLRRVSLLAPAAMSGGGLDDLRSLITNVEADLAASAAACGCQESREPLKLSERRSSRCPPAAAHHRQPSGQEAR
jgi:hypothetical protein